ncbi:BPL-N domain-containing protein [Chlamydiifrater volucris]|uniref:BPL-N domain-containing protein n=1 Tax=Chlamydiifrater volucris TaxID=2681470 RepID=UPI001BCE59C0|nr:BPL-N domain-containing protein [Chlamydiifrater volucris]
MKNILVYSGEGVSAYFLRHVVRYLNRNISHFSEEISVNRVNDSYLKDNPFWEESAVLLVMPGGADRPYHRRLSGRGTSRIRGFVEGGGSYLGICAGAYFASAFVYFEETEPKKNIIDEARDLRFFPGTAVGPAYGGGFSYHDFRGVRPAFLELQTTLAGTKTVFSSLFHGGCYFDKADKFPGIVVEGRYSDIEGSPAAIISAKIGAGSVVLSGVHFEYQPDLCRIRDPHVQKTKEQIATPGNQGVLETFDRGLFSKLLEREGAPAL